MSLTPEQAEIIAEQILNEASPDRTAGITVPRFSRFAGLLLGILPWAWILRHIFAAPRDWWIYLLLGTVVTSMFVIAVYKFFTPLLRINKTDCIYYSYWPWGKKIIRVEDVEHVFLTTTLIIRATSVELMIQTNERLVKVYISRYIRHPTLPTLHKNLVARFGDRYRSDLGILGFQNSDS